MEPNVTVHILYHHSTSHIYLHIQHSLADRAAVVLFVPPGGVAHDADRLIVRHAEELELLSVKRAQLLRVAVQLPRRLLQTLTLLHVRLAQVLQGEAGHGIVQRLASAQRAVAAPSVPPVLL